MYCSSSNSQKNAEGAGDRPLESVRTMAETVMKFFKKPEYHLTTLVRIYLVFRQTKVHEAVK